jgi:hypothetical protein
MVGYVKIAGCTTIMAQFPSPSGLQDSLTYMCYTSKCLYMSLRYKYRSSHPEDRKLPITELKWDARTVTDIPGNTAHCFFAFFWLTEGSRNKN